MEVVVILLFVVFVLVISSVQVNSHKQRITEQIHSIGGQIVRIERKSVFTGPFVGVRRGRTVYRIEYRKDGMLKEGWVKFGDLSGPDWRL
jgi:hypothetical protein